MAASRMQWPWSNSQGARDLHLGCHAGELELDGLELGDRLAELDALLRIAQGRLEGRLAHADGAGGMGDAAALERPGHLLEAALAPAEERCHRDLHVVEGE